MVLSHSFFHLINEFTQGFPGYTTTLLHVITREGNGLLKTGDI
jgi:hypothetical protein